MASVASIIQRHESDIVERWLAKARAAASARGLSNVALENVMPLYLAALGEKFGAREPETAAGRARHLQSHISTRLRQGFDLAEIVDEFVLLGSSIGEAWLALPAEEWPSPAEIERLNAEIRSAIADVTNTFTRHMLHDEQFDKRYLRLLQDLASEALADKARPLRDRLREVLDLVMEAMGAQSAAFLAYDVENAQLVLVACAGAEPLEEYATSVDPRSFAGEVATHDEPTPMRDASTTSLDVPDSLRRSGIHSLLGVRLPPINNLVGVLYIGVAEAREFTAAESRRITLLGERIALHLENARLFSELRDKIAALDIEKALRERFVSTLAHDLRGPLSAARLAADMLALEPASLDKRRELGAMIGRSIDRVDRMIRDLLDANRIRAGEPLPLRLDTCNLAAIAEHVAAEAGSQHGDRFVVHANGPILGVWSEQDLHRALWNLVANAVKYGAPDRPITIEVRLVDDVVRLSVHNEGPVIPVDEHRQIFDAYTRSPTAATDGRMGWGLGLTLVRGTAEAHGGRVSVTSDASSGTTFTVELPVDARRALGIAAGHAPATVH